MQHIHAALSKHHTHNTRGTSQSYEASETELQPTKAKWKQHSHKSRSKSHKRYSSEHKNQRQSFKKFDPCQAHKRRHRCLNYGDSKHLEGLKCPARKFQCKTCNKYGHFSACATRSNHLLNLEILKHISCKWQ